MFLLENITVFNKIDLCSTLSMEREKYLPIYSKEQPMLTAEFILIIMETFLLYSTKICNSKPQLLRKFTGGYLDITRYRNKQAKKPKTNKKSPIIKIKIQEVVESPNLYFGGRICRMMFLRQ